jgi:hypothetical protein
VTSYQLEYLTPHASSHDERVVRFSRDFAADQLAGRTIWCGVETPATTRAQTLDVPVGEQLRELAARIDAALTGAVGDMWLGSAERELCGQALELVDPRIASDDIVVLHDAVTALLAQAVRERGAHTVWLLGGMTQGRSAGMQRAWEFMQPFTTAVDAYVTTQGDAVAAVMPSAAVVTVKAGPDRELDWTGMLADVLEADRAQSVGGTVSVRPAVAAR